MVPIIILGYSIAYCVLHIAFSDQNIVEELRRHQYRLLFDTIVTQEEMKAPTT